AFIADTSGLDQAWAIPASGGEPRQLTSFGERVGLVKWSPDGAFLLVTVDAGGNEHDQLYLISATGGEPHRLSDEPDVIHTFGAWSPDGRRLCYPANRRHRAYFDVWVHDLATSEDRCVMAQDATLTALAWSPDGFSLLVSRENTNLDNDLFLIPLDG